MIIHCYNIQRCPCNIVFIYYDLNEVMIMKLTFDYFVSNLSQYEIELYKNSTYDLTFKEVRFLYDSHIDLKKNTLYLATTSILSKRADNLSEIGFLLIKDCDFAPSGLQSDIAIFSHNTNMFKLFDDVLNIFNSNQQLVNSSATLLNSLIKGKGLNYIIQVGSEILGNPVFLVDSSSKLLAASTNSNIDDTFWNDLANSGYGNNDNLAPYVYKGFVDHVIQSDLPVLIDLDIPHNLKRIVGKIQLNDKIVGYIGVLENSQAFKEEDITIIDLLCDVVASEMKNSKLYDNLTGLRHEFLLIDLLDGRIGNDTIAMERAKAIFHGANNNLFVLVLNPPENIVNSHVLGYIRWSFESLLPSCKSVYYSDHLVLIVNLSDMNQWQDTRMKIIDILKKNKLVAGLSHKFDNMIDIKKYYNQAESALRLSKLLKKYDFLQDYEDLYIHDLLTKLKEGTKANDFCHPSLLKIQDYDKINGTDYYKTLYEYLICGGNITLMAKRLFVHRNTVVHRINKIQELTGIQLSDGNNRFKLLLSYRIMELPAL